MLTEGVSESLRNMELGTHAVLIYDTPENKREVLFNHLRMGVSKEGLVYACSEEKPETIRSELGSFGIDVEALEKEGSLIVKNFDEVYIVDGKVNAPKIISGFSGLAREYEMHGKTGIRASGEMSCFFEQERIPELLEYEKALQTRFAFPGKGICAYNLMEMELSGNLEVLWPILSSHGLVIMTGPHGSFSLTPDKVDHRMIQETMSVKI